MSRGSHTLKLIYRARKAGAKYSRKIIQQARRHDLDIALGFALVEKESGFRNIFGCDFGAPLCHQPVTKDRVQELIRHIKRGGASNGVGLTQLTYPPFIYAAEAKGGAHLPENQLDVGFKTLADLVRQYGEWAGCRRYNGSGPAAEAYANDLLARKRKWKEILK